MKLLLLFIILNIVNVILQTIKSIATIKCGKLVASVVNAVAFGLYTIVIVYTNCELSLWAKVLVVALTNLIGVYVVKSIEEKMRKDKLWKISATVKNKNIDKTVTELVNKQISYSLLPIINDDYTAINIYSRTQNDSLAVKEILNKYGAKYFVSESKVL